MKLRDAMQRIALEFPSYGWPRMTEELKRRGTFECTGRANAARSIAGPVSYFHYL
jgi:hypothetical protein